MIRIAISTAPHTEYGASMIFCKTNDYDSLYVQQPVVSTMPSLNDTMHRSMSKLPAGVWYCEIIAERVVW